MPANDETTPLVIRSDSDGGLEKFQSYDHDHDHHTPSYHDDGHYTNTSNTRNKEGWTYGRRVSAFLSRYRWYNPQGCDLDRRDERRRTAAEGGGDDRNDYSSSGEVILNDERFFDPVSGDGGGGGGGGAAAAEVSPATQQPPPPPPPSLRAAWEHFEHVVLARHFVDGRCKPKNGASAADDGEAADASPSSVSKGEEEEVRDVLRRAEPGENEHPTSLYPVLRTSENDLADFGLGVASYFLALRYLAVMVFVVGVMNLPLLWHYAGAEYNHGSEAGSAAAVAAPQSGFWALRGSAICTRTKWVACPTCTREVWESTFPSTLDRYAEMTVTDGGAPLKFVKINDCPLDPAYAYYAYASVLFVLVATVFLRRVARKREVVFDESAQTSTDYSVQVVNPPGDAWDAEEWRAFFSRLIVGGDDKDNDDGNDNDDVDGGLAGQRGGGGPVVCCTVALDNEELVRALAERRELLVQLADLQPPGGGGSADLLHCSRAITSDGGGDRRYLDEAVENALPLPWNGRLMFLSDATALRARIVDLEETIGNDLARRTYAVSRVFVTFETEASQRAALDALSVSGLERMRHNLFRRRGTAEGGKKGRRANHLLFRGEHMLHVNEPEEPSSVRWQDLDESFLTRLRQRTFTFLVATVLMIGGCSLVAYIRYTSGPVNFAITVMMINTAIPYLCYYLVVYLESHPDEGSRQASMYIKVTAAMFVNTTLVTFLVTPFADTLTYDKDDSSSLMPTVVAVYFEELFRTPIINVLDVVGNVYRHILGPRASDQRRMNLCFVGTEYDLSERYTSMTNVLLLTFWYGSIFPAGYFFCAAILIVHYWSDKFCLLRSWAPAPLVGAKIGEHSRDYFMNAAVIVFTIASSYTFASFPYDNACEVNGTVVSPDYVGTFSIIDLGGNPSTASISADDINYAYCNQDMLRHIPPIFPAVPSKQPQGREWMSTGQGHVCGIFGWTSVVVLVCGVLLMLRGGVFRTVYSLFFKPFTKASRGDERKTKNFSEVLDIFGYVPQVKIPGFVFPTLFCDVSNVGGDIMPWSDPANPSFDHHCAIYDLPRLYNPDVSDDNPPIFSTIHHWPLEMR